MRTVYVIFTIAALLFAVKVGLSVATIGNDIKAAHAARLER